MSFFSGFRVISSELVVRNTVLFRRFTVYRTSMQAAQATKSQDRNEQPLSRKIVETVAKAEGIAPTELDTRLYDVIEPEALNNLFQHQEDGSATDRFVSFTFHGYTITVHSDSSVEISQINS